MSSHRNSYGSLRSRGLFSIDWIQQTSSLKLHGISFSAYVVATTRLNWENIFKTLEGILMRNIYRYFTFSGRVLFIKQHVLSQATHLAHVLPCSKTHAISIRQKFGIFLWAQRSEHPALNVLIRPRGKGGLGAVLPYEFFMSLFTKTTKRCSQKHCTNHSQVPRTQRER